MPPRTPKVAVVGATYVDMAIRCAHVPTPGQSVQGSEFEYSPTGPGLNQAIEAALCGCDVHLISKVGECPFSQTIKETLEKYKVNTEFVFTAQAKNTGIIVTLVDGVGENASCIWPGANMALTQQDIILAEKSIADADVCLIHGQLPQEAIVAAIRCAEIYGTKTILNPARPMEQKANQATDLPIEYFSANILIPNLYEAADITDQSNASINTAKIIGSDLIARGSDSAVITMGKHGCMAIDRTGADHIAAFSVELVDKACAGDAFAGALAASCAVGDDLRKAVKFASAAGALACTKFGAIEALPKKADIIELLQKEDIG